MFNGPPIGFCFGSTSDVNNLMCSIDGCDIFVDSSFVSEYISKSRQLNTYKINP